MHFICCHFQLFGGESDPWHGFNTNIFETVDGLERSILEDNTMTILDFLLAPVPCPGNQSIIKLDLNSTGNSSSTSTFSTLRSPC